MNTLKTLAGFMLTMAEKYTPLRLSKHSLEGIYNYHKVNHMIVTSGQPSEEQFLLIREAGYKKVINLAPHNTENSLADEALLLRQLGLKYIHIPVDFKNPTREDFQQFVELINVSSLDETWFHCAANMRVSAFVYKYRCEILNEDRQKAEQDLAKIWTPLGVWKKFIATPQ
ncbi:MAG: protein tyrosine phosphatase (PTP) superfamily phosphohydrolase (DUF442 family) [Arenicella sp.]|jgi:protein tyrosine phosphatase (PTP) superfamily phosphohydrolase (DUF442 family)